MSKAGTHIDETNFTQTIYKPVEYVQIQETKLSNAGSSEQETVVSYSYRLQSFSEEEIMEYLKKPNNGLLQLPFINSIDFRKEEIEQQLRNAFDILRDAHIISSITDIFGQIRFIIYDQFLRDLINKIWIIHEYQLDILYRKMDFIEAPNKIEKDWLEQVLGKGEACRIIKEADLKRRSINKKSVLQMQNSLENYIKNMEGFKLYISKTFESIILEYGLPKNLIERVCLGRLF